MNTNANESIHCPGCGRPLPVGILAGLCPACLPAQGEDTESAGAPDRQRFEPPSTERIANLFPQLEVRGLLGAGGMGAVYQARQPKLDRMVALKVLPVGRGTGSAERFNREARALARLSHPNIVSVHEFGQVEGLHYFVMEFVDGTNLRQLEKISRLSPREALQIIPQICDALQYAHDEGIVHRDIKPENVLIDRKGRVKIADFGLAKIVDPDPATARLTVEGQVMGTPHYMAPEQLERPLSVDHRADIYALGVVFYEMLTGDLPIGKFAPPSRKVELDVRLDEIVLRALENDPERRYQKVSEVKSEVQTVMDAPSLPPTRERTRAIRGRGFPGVPDGHGTRPPHWKRVIWTAAAAAGVLVLGFILYAAATEHWSSREQRRVSVETGRSENPDLGPGQVAQRNPANGSVYVDLPNGSRVELLAVSKVSAATNQWWRPGGALVAGATYHIDGPADMAGPDEQKNQLALRIIGTPAIMENAIYDFSPPANISAGGVVQENGARLEGGWPLRVRWLSATQSATLRFGFRLDPWRTITALNLKDPALSYSRVDSDDQEWIASFNHHSDDGTNTLLTVVLNREPENWRMRVVAVDSDGLDHYYNRGRSTPIGATETWTCNFPDLTLDRISEFRVQVQPVHWVEFRDVALRAAEKSVRDNIPDR